MSRLDALPADQKSVLQLLLRQGKGYDDLSELLKLESGEVRSRAYDALDTLGPGAGGLPSERRHEISDWLLGQQGPDDAAATREFVEGSSAGRAWARAVAGELEPLAGGRLPELPPEAGPAAEAAAPVGAAAPAGAAAPVGAAAAAEAAAPVGAPAAEEAPAAEAAAPGETPTPFAPAPAAGPRVSRRGGMLLIGGALAAIAVAVVLIVVLTGGDDKKSDTGTKAADTTSSTAAKPQVRAQINLTAPKGSPAKKAIAIVQIVENNGQQTVNAVSQGLKVDKNAAYGIWAYNSPSQAKLIGGFDKTDNNGHLVYQGALPSGVDLSTYKDVLVTRETSGNPTKPGTIYLRGKIQAAAGG